jgi:adenylate cyclase
MAEILHKTKTKSLVPYEPQGRRRDNPIFSIGVKLVTIVTMIVLVSLGSITALVSWLVRQDLQITAEDGNFEANRRSAAEAEDTLLKMRSDALTHIHTITAEGTKTVLARNNTAYFFKQNPRIAALIFTTPKGEELLINDSFFFLREIESSLARTFSEQHKTALRQVKETTVINASAHFGSHILAMSFPGDSGGAMALFAPDNLNTSFSAGTNQSWMINNTGDILVHSDYEYVKNGVNVAEYDFIRAIQDSPTQSRQSLVETDFGFQPGFQSGVTRINMGGGGINADFFNFKRTSPNKGLIRQFLAYTKLNTGGCIVITSIEYDKVFEGIAATTRRNIYLTVAVLAFSIMLILFFSKSISVPLKALAAAALQIEGGTFDLEIQPHKSRDEIGLLTGSFQKMCSALHIFGKFTNKEIAVKAMRGEIKPGGLPKHATIFFSDIRGFTEKSETFTNVFGEDAPDKIIHWLNEYFTKMIECVEKTSGTIDKFIGDSVMAHWGTAYSTGSPARDALNAVISALMMRKALYEMNRKRRKGDPANPVIRIGCGLNTGIVTAGQLGSEQRMEYTVIGDPVNLASRIEALNKPLGTDILISEDTYNFVKEYIIAEEMPSVNVKGKEKKLRIFAVINFASLKKGPKTLAEVRSLMGIEAPDINAVDINADEKKYKIENTRRRKEWAK